MPTIVTLGSAGARGFGLFGGLGPIGAPYWFATLGSSGTNDQAQGVTVDANGNVYVVGRTNTASIYGWIVTKYNTSGVIQWQRKLSSSGITIYGFGIAIDSASNIYVCGSNDNGAAVADYLLAKYDSSGTLQFQTKYASAQDERANAVTLDSSGNIYLVGYSIPSNQYMSFAKLNSSGVVQWKYKLGDSSGTGFVQGVALDSSSNVYMAGSYDNNGTTSSAFVLVKYNSAGTQQWKVKDGSANAAIAYGVAIDTANRINVIGINGSNGVLIQFDTTGAANWGRILSFSGSGGITWTSVATDSLNNVYACGWCGNNGYPVIVIAKYNSSGTIQWQRQFYGPWPRELGYGIKLDRSDNIYICAWSSPTGSQSDYDYFIAKLPSDGSKTGNYTLTGVGSYTYAASSYTSNNFTTTISAVSMTESSVTLTASTTTFTDATSSLTSTTKTI